MLKTFQQNRSMFALDLSNRTIIITGAIGGIGIALTTAVLQAGGDAFCIDLIPQAPEGKWSKIVDYAQKAGAAAYYHSCDVTSEEQVIIAIENAKKVSL